MRQLVHFISFHFINEAHFNSNIFCILFFNTKILVTIKFLRKQQIKNYMVYEFHILIIKKFRKIYFICQQHSVYGQLTHELYNLVCSYKTIKCSIWKPDTDNQTLPPGMLPIQGHQKKNTIS